jgi:hypothetical protein
MWAAFRALVVVGFFYLTAAYLVLPNLWRHYEHQPALAGAPKVTTTDAGLPGDPLNVGLVGSREDVERAFAAAGWRAAAALGLRSDLGIARSVLADRPDPTAPVSDLLLFGRAQDLAFEKEVGASARQRHHVRFWQHGSPGQGSFWIGAASFDRGVGVSHRTGQITHHVAPDIDAERDLVMEDLVGAGQLSQRYQVSGIGPTLNGRNGGGDRYFSDGELDVGVLTMEGAPRPTAPEVLPNPVAIVAKQRVWSWMRPLIARAE